MPIAGKALSDPKEFYDARYNAGYMTDFSDLFEGVSCHYRAPSGRVLKAERLSPGKVFDYGCGGGASTTPAPPPGPVAASLQGIPAMADRPAFLRAGVVCRLPSTC